LQHFVALALAEATDAEVAKNQKISIAKIRQWKPGQEEFRALKQLRSLLVD